MNARASEAFMTAPPLREAGDQYDGVELPRTAPS